MTIFTTKGKYNMGTNHGAIIKAENENGALFTEVAGKEIILGIGN